MKITTFRNDEGYWNLSVNGRLVIEDESYTVVSNVAYFLEHPELLNLDVSECGDVARSILDAHETGNL